MTKNSKNDPSVPKNALLKFEDDGPESKIEK